ncbi:unnamed protein product, partial [Candidula unifasciata]
SKRKQSERPVTVLEPPDDPELEAGVAIGSTNDLVNVLEEIEKESKDTLPDQRKDLKRITSSEIRERFFANNPKKGKKKQEKPTPGAPPDVNPPISVVSDTAPVAEQPDPANKKEGKKKKKEKKSKGDAKKTPSGAKPAPVASDTSTEKSDVPKRKDSKKLEKEKKRKGSDRTGTTRPRGSVSKLAATTKKTRKKKPQETELG